MWSQGRRCTRSTPTLTNECCKNEQLCWRENNQGAYSSNVIPTKLKVRASTYTYVYKKEKNGKFWVTVSRLGRLNALSLPTITKLFRYVPSWHVKKISTSLHFMHCIWHFLRAVSYLCQLTVLHVVIWKMVWYFFVCFDKTEFLFFTFFSEELFYFHCSLADYFRRQVLLWICSSLVLAGFWFQFFLFFIVKRSRDLVLFVRWLH